MSKFSEAIILVGTQIKLLSFVTEIKCMQKPTEPNKSKFFFSFKAVSGFSLDFFFFK